MKTMTCRELGGTCDQKLSAGSWEEMVKVMTKHVMEKHPDVAKKMEQMHNEDPKKWGKEMKPKWEAAPEILRSRVAIGPSTCIPFNELITVPFATFALPESRHSSRSIADVRPVPTFGPQPLRSIRLRVTALRRGRAQSARNRVRTYRARGAMPQ